MLKIPVLQRHKGSLKIYLQYKIYERKQKTDCHLRPKNQSHPNKTLGTKNMLKLTLDTNCIINLLDYKSESATSVDELTEILRYGLDGDVNIAITTRVETDFDKDKNEERKIELRRRISMFPVIGTVARFGASKFGSGDVYAGEEHETLERELTNIIFPGLNKDDAHFTNKLNDVDHLIGHKINKRDVFITDDQQILKRAETLESSLRIKVMDPKKALEYLNLKGNKGVLAQEFYNRFLEYKKLISDALENGNISKDSIQKYEDLRKWLIRKHSVISDGLLSYKFQMSSVPISGQRVFSQDHVATIQSFNDRFNALLKERDPLHIPKVITYNDYSSHYISPNEENKITLNYLDVIEDTLLGYLGKLEEK